MNEYKEDSSPTLVFCMMIIVIMFLSIKLCGCTYCTTCLGGGYSLTPDEQTAGIPEPEQAGRVDGGVDDYNIVVTLDPIYFELNRYLIRPAFQYKLQLDAEALRRNPTANLVIHGHACDLGEADYNVALSEQRAAAVKQYLVTLGAGADQITIRAHGEEDPICEEPNEACRSLRRRAEFQIP
jgi:outer membrane protein OmpA-like peptidoglycan-associated protein